MEMTYKKQKCSIEKMDFDEHYFAEIDGEKTVVTKRLYGDMDEHQGIFDINNEMYYDDEIDFILTSEN